MDEPSGCRTARGSKTELADGSIFVYWLGFSYDSCRQRVDLIIVRALGF